ncbi:uncharacterized protein KIAA2013 homolog isoform X2 [Venturia canescens]|nr:uncharacterized protein KIAA2013 homolog isoform X2 [Venturia canescens]
MCKMRASGMFDAYEFSKRMRRIIDGNYSYRKILLLVILVGGIILYCGPSLAKWLYSSNTVEIKAFQDHCIEERLDNFRVDAAEYNLNILHDPPLETEHKYLPYIGNGIFAIPINTDGRLYIKNQKTLSLALRWRPLVSYSISQGSLLRETTVTHFVDGIVHRYQCFSDGYYIHSQYYAHRVLDGILVQDINIGNPSSLSQEIFFQLLINKHKSGFEESPVKISIDDAVHEFTMASAFVPSSEANKMIAVSILYKEPPKSIQLKARTSEKLTFFTSIQYSEPLVAKLYQVERTMTEKRCIDMMRRALLKHEKSLRDEHVDAWRSYWHTGLRISDSKAKDSLNGHKINSTMYYVLSQIPKSSTDLEKVIANNEDCYRGHHTLEAPRLWEDTGGIEGVNSVTRAWLITLEKQECHRLMTGGPAAVQQAMVLSLGGLRFSNQHLEFNIDPQYLHRDYLFRRISYGNVTHLNISVTVGDDNRAILGVALDRSDSTYFACDAGCLDDPVPLTQSYTNFPVKLTKPLTAILYVTSDYQHMQVLRNVLHVHAVDEAPAHDHHLMALHKHGHQLGGLPTFFWVSICFLIVVFHLFLFKIIITEYWGHQDRQRTRNYKI